MKLELLVCFEDFLYFHYFYNYFMKNELIDFLFDMIFIL